VLILAFLALRSLVLLAISLQLPVPHFSMTATTPHTPHRWFLCYDSSTDARNALRHLCALVKPDDHVVVAVCFTKIEDQLPIVLDALPVDVTPHVDYDKENKRRRKHAEQLAAQAERTIKQAVPHALTVQLAIVEGDARDALLTTARRAHANTIVVGSRGYGPVRRLVLGSVSLFLATHSEIPVLICSTHHARL